MDTTTIPQTIRRLTVAPFLHALLELDSPDSPVQIRRVRELHSEALGPGRRKRTAHFELRGERDVLDWLRLHGLTLFVPSAEAAVRSLVEDGRLARPAIGKRYSVYAMLPGDQFVALVRHDAPDGRTIVDGQLELPYDRDAQAAAAQIADPMTRVISAAILDTHAVLQSTRREDH